MTDVEAQLRGFFERYAQSFHLDVPAFCDNFHFPSTTVRLDGSVHVFQAKEDAVEFFTAARRKFEAEGCIRWAIDRFIVTELGVGSAAVTIDWTMLRADGSPIRGWRQTYNVIGGPNRWRVLLSTLHAGSER